MEQRLKDLFEEIVLTLREDASRQGAELDPLVYAEEESARWRSARESEEGIWFSLLLQMLRHGFPKFDLAYDQQAAIREHLGDFTALAELDEKGKKKLAEREDLDLNLQRVRSVAKNARTAVMLQDDFGSLKDLISTFETEEDLAAGIEEMFSYMKGRAAVEFTREMGWKKPGNSPGVRRVLSRMRDLVDGSLDVEGIQRAIAGLSEATGYEPGMVDFVLELFASGDDRIKLHSICNVNFACYRCRVSDSQCAERRYEFGTAKEIVREEAE